jgi:glycoprotein endo-alpha-1,2-mannosidase
MKASHTVFIIALITVFFQCVKEDPSDRWHPDTTQSIQATIGVYYYPWYSSSFNDYLRQYLNPTQLPLLGEYSDRNSTTLQTHFDWCRYAGISILITSWWGPNSETDVTTRQYMLPHSGLQDLKIALHYETTGRIGHSNYYRNIRSDFTYMANNYFNDPHYFKINNKPVVVIYLSRVLDDQGIIDSCVALMRQAARDNGFEMYLIGDHAYGDPNTAPTHFGSLDAITNYDVYGCVGIRYAGMSAVQRFSYYQHMWHALAAGRGVDFIPAVSPGFNDHAVRAGHVPLCRRLDSSSAEGSLFREEIRWIKGECSQELGNLIFVNSWNEWHEDSQIEPVAKAAATNRDISSSGIDYTNNLYYEGYDSLYLSILREELNN